MDHAQIDQLNLIDRYLMGKMSPEESVDFEEHFVDCPRCLDQLQTTKGFLRDLRFMAVEQAIEPERPRWRTAVGAFAPWRFRKPPAWAAACLVIAALAVAAGIFYTRRLEAQIDQVKSLSGQWERRYEESQQAAASADRQHQEAVERRDEQLRALEARLRDEEAQRASMAAAANRQTPFAASPSVFMLTSQRGASPTPEAGIPITLPPGSTQFFLLIPLEGEQRFKHYRLTILDRLRRPIGPGQRRTPDQNNSLSLLVNSGFFRPGYYSLIVEGLPKAGRAEIVGDYPFQVIKSRE